MVIDPARIGRRLAMELETPYGKSGNRQREAATAV
jgi:hypothetical protein